MGRKKFGKNAESVRHFRLVARSGCVADDSDATPLVLEPYVPPGEIRRTGLSEAELLELPDSLKKLDPDFFGQGDRGDPDEPLLEEEEEGEEKDELADLESDCYFPHDGYNYEKHLKRMSGTGKAGGVVGVVLEAPKKLGARPGVADCAPVDAKEIAIQAPRTKEEEEVMRALEFADEYEELDEGELEDVFEGGLAEDNDVMLFGPSVYEQREMPDMGALKAAHKAMLEAGAYGGGSSGSANLPEGGEAYVDDEGQEIDFDDFLENEYAEDEIGACDDEEIAGHMTFQDADDVVDEYIEEQKNENQLLYSENEPIAGKYDNVPRVIEETRAIIEKQRLDEERREDDDDATETVRSDEETDDSHLWDCETVLSTLSNISNRPGKIGKIKVGSLGKKKEELPKLDEEAEQEDDESSSEDDIIELPEVILERKKGETPEEKRERKNSVKEMRRVCRRMKKESKEMYKAEALKLPGNKATSDLKFKTRYQRL